MTTVSIPDDLLERAKRAAKNQSAEDVVVLALDEYARRHDQAELLKYLGKSDGFFTADELDRSRAGE